VFEVIGYPPARRWWQFWIPIRPQVLRASIDYSMSAGGDEATIFRPRRGWTYKVAFTRA
jgi:hypothetical protein